MKLYAAVALFGLAAIKASPIPDGLFDNAASDDCEDISEPAELPDIDAPVFDVQQPVEDSPDCEGEAIEEETILDIQPAFQMDSEAYNADEECEEDVPVTEAPVINKDVQPEEPPCYDEDNDNNDPVDPIIDDPVIMKDNNNNSGFNPLNYESEDSYDDYY